LGVYAGRNRAYCFGRIIQGVYFYGFAQCGSHVILRSDFEGRRSLDLHPKLDFKKHGNSTHPPICFLFKCVS
jgi:hypothetical protein